MLILRRVVVCVLVAASLTVAGPVSPVLAIDGVIETFGGDGTAGFGGDGGTALAARLTSPAGVAVDAMGNVYIADLGNNRVRVVDSAGVISTFAGDGTLGFGGDGGAATSAQLGLPVDVAVDALGNVYIADQVNARVRVVDSAGVISTFAGDGTFGFGGDGGAATSAQLAGPQGVAVDTNGNVYIAEGGNSRVRVVDSAGVISTFAGDGTSGFGGDGGAATSAQLNDPAGVAVDDEGDVYIVDRQNARVRVVDAAGVISTFAGDGTAGFGGDGGAATSAQLDSPARVAFDDQGNVYIADSGNNRARVVDAGGVISTFAGDGTAGFGGDGGEATSAQMWAPFGVAVGAAGQVYITDFGNNRVRSVDTGGAVPGCVVQATFVTSSLGQGECDALVALYAATGGGVWANSAGWDTASDPCGWHGVTCDSGARVLSLANNGLVGVLPAELGDLVSLEVLNLKGNSLSGEIPAELGGLARLVRLYLHGNDLSGEIPVELGGLVSLDRLYLYSNDLSGEIPVELGDLAQLSRLYLHKNELSGEIPGELGRLDKLSRLYLYDNALTGDIAAGLGDFDRLRRMYLYNNALTGEIPAELGNLTKLQFLYLYNNSLSGEIPAEFSGLASLRRLYVHNNTLAGEVPAELGGLAGLNRLYLHKNELSGEIPVGLGEMSMLTHLLMSRNALVGTVPTDLGDLDDLTNLELSHNMLTGDLTPAFTDLVDTLAKVRLADGAGRNDCFTANPSLSTFLDAANPAWDRCDP